ncbi:hypothetical protein Tco_0146118 [Tanacetum coccineum]
MRTIIKEEVTTQLPQILPQAVYYFATPVIEKNVAESLEVAVLKRSSSQPQSTYEAAAALFEKSSKEAESSRDSRSKEKKSSSTSKDASHSQQKPSSKSTHAEEPSHTVDDLEVQQDQEFDTCNNDEQPANKEDFFINNDLEYLNGGDLSKWYSTSVTKTKAATYEIKWIEDLVRNLWSPVTVKYDKHAYWGLTIMKKHDYGHLEKIEVRREDQKLYKFREGDFPRLPLQDIEDMLLLLVQQKLTNLTIDERSNLRNKTTYTAYSDPKGVIYKDQNNRKRLMRADELHKFSDGTLNDVQTTLNNIAKGIRMEYLPKRK